MSKERFKWLVALIAVIALLIAGRLYRLHLRKEWLKPLVVQQRGDLIDISLPVISKSCDAHGGCAVETDGLYQGKPTGLTINFAPGMRPSIFTDRVETTQIFPRASGITFVIEGPRGNSFVRLLAASYGMAVHRVDLPGTVLTTAIAFEGDPADIQTSPLKFKIIHFGSKNSPEYFEIFINSDLANNRIQLSEKETGYRPALLKTFGVE